MRPAILGAAHRFLVSWRRFLSFFFALAEVPGLEACVYHACDVTSCNPATARPSFPRENVLTSVFALECCQACFRSRVVAVVL